MPAVIPNGSATNSGTGEAAMTTRLITVLCLVQAVLLTAAWMLTSSFVHTAQVRHPASAFFVPRQLEWLANYRYWGLSLLAVPGGTVWIGCRFSRSYRGMRVLGVHGATLTVIMTILTAGFAVFVVYASAQHAFGPGMSSSGFR